MFRENWYHPSAQLHLRYISLWCYTLVTLVMSWIDYSVQCWTCRFWKVCLGLSIFHRSIMEGNWPAWISKQVNFLPGCSGYHWFVCLLGLQVLLMLESQQQWYRCSCEKSWWWYCALWRCRFSPAIIMVVFLLAATMRTCIQHRIERSEDCAIQIITWIITWTHSKIKMAFTELK